MTIPDREEPLITYLVHQLALLKVSVHRIGYHRLYFCQDLTNHQDQLCHLDLSVFWNGTIKEEWVSYGHVPTKER